jgi:hypothetical protein
MKKLLSIISLLFVMSSTSQIYVINVNVIQNFSFSKKYETLNEATNNNGFNYGVCRVNKEGLTTSYIVNLNNNKFIVITKNDKTNNVVIKEEFVITNLNKTDEILNVFYLYQEDNKEPEYRCLLLNRTVGGKIVMHILCKDFTKIDNEVYGWFDPEVEVKLNGNPLK